MADYRRLKTKLAEAPYAGLSHAEAATALRTRTKTRSRPVVWRDVKGTALRTGHWAMVAALSRNTPSLPPATPQDMAILAAINAVAMDDSRKIDPDDPGEWQPFVASIGALRTAGCLTQEVADAVLALGTETISEGAEIGWPAVTEFDVEAARGMTDAGK